MRVGFISCVQLGLSCMESIYEAGGRLVFAGTLRDGDAVAKSGRVYLDGFCAQHGIPLMKFANVNDPDAVAAIRAADLDWLMIIGWSQIARQVVLGLPRLGVLGMHPTLLPMGRGRAAIPWAILLGLPETGVTLFKLDGGVDTGPVIAQARLLLTTRETATSLYRRVNDAHRTLLAECWPQIASGTVRLTPQDERQAVVWPGRTPEQGRLDPAMSIAEADRLVRAVTRPYPGAFIDLKEGRLKVWAGEPDDVKPHSADTPVLPFRDGWLTVKDFEWENSV